MACEFACGIFVECGCCKQKTGMAGGINDDGERMSEQCLFRFQIHRERECEAQTVQTYGKRSRQSARLIWKWN
jgi:hypothetical protein